MCPHICINALQNNNATQLFTTLFRWLMHSVGEFYKSELQICFPTSEVNNSSVSKNLTKCIYKKEVNYCPSTEKLYTVNAYVLSDVKIRHEVNGCFLHGRCMGSNLDIIYKSLP